METTTWKGGGESYGIRVGHDNASRYFMKEWVDIKVKIDGKYHTFNLKETFWTTCPEFRGKSIKKWLEKRGMHRWNEGQPYVLELVRVGYKQFELLEPTGETSNKRYGSINTTI